MCVYVRMCADAGYSHTDALSAWGLRTGGTVIGDANHIIQHSEGFFTLLALTEAQSVWS